MAQAEARGHQLAAGAAPCLAATPRRRLWLPPAKSGAEVEVPNSPGWGQLAALHHPARGTLSLHLPEGRRRGRGSVLGHKPAIPYQLEEQSRGPRSSGQRFDTCILFFLQHRTMRPTPRLPSHLQERPRAPRPWGKGSREEEEGGFRQRLRPVRR